MMVDWLIGLLQAIDGKMLFNYGKMVVNDGEMAFHHH